MRTGTGIIEATYENGLAKVQTNRNNLYTPCSDSMCDNNVVIDAVNTIGAAKGQFVKFNIPEDKVAVGGVMCFGMPLALIIIWGIFGYWFGSNYGYTCELTAFAGMIAGGLIGAFLLKQYEKKINNNATKVEIVEIIGE